MGHTIAMRANITQCSHLDRIGRLKISINKLTIKQT